MLSINPVNHHQVNTYAPKASIPINFGSKDALGDSFTQVEEKTVDKSTNGKFDFSEAGKHFLKGLISPITAVIKHPIATIGLVAGTIAACSLVPVLGPALAVGFGAYSLFQLGKGCFDVAKNCFDGNYDAAENSFNTVGEGTIGTILSALGIRQSAKVAQESKLMSKLNATTLNTAQRGEIATNVNKAGFISNLKDSLSLFTTKDGLKSVGFQFKKDVLKTRFNEFKALFDKSKWIKEKEIEIERKGKSFEEKVKEFKQSAEGQRRAALSDEQIKAEVEALYNDAFDRLGIPQEQRPTLEIVKNDANKCGSYTKGGHRIEFNPESYKSGVTEIENVIMHEATHCREALLRAGIPQERVDAIVIDELIGRIRYGEAEEIIKGAGFLGADMTKPPKMSKAMSEDFIQFAKDNLYHKDSALGEIIQNLDHQYSIRELTTFRIENLQNAEKAAQSIIDKLKTLIKKHPNFVEQYGTEQKALEALVGYSRSHNFRYNYFTNTKINRNMFAGTYADYIEAKPLTGDALARAEKSLVDEIATVEGNGRASGKFFGCNEAEFNQYQFSPEEVLAQKNGNTYLIEKMTAKINEMRASGTLTPEQEAYLTKVIEKAKIVIEYKTKGLEYYKKYTQMINNPNDSELAATVKAMENELNALKAKISPDEWQKVTKIIKMISIPEHTSILIPKVAIYKILNSLNSEKTA